MNRKTIYTLAAIVGSSVTYVGCSDDFLDKKPLAALTTDTYYSNETEMTKGLTAAYYPLLLDGMYDLQFANMLEVASDDAMGSVASQPTFERYTFDPSTGSFRDAWSTAYRGIARANLVLENAGKAEMSQALKDRMSGEASFLRGLYYFNLVNLFGGVPLVTKTLPPSELKLPASTAAEVWTQIEKDFTEAAAKLPVKSAIQAGRATKGAAQAMLAKTYLFQKKWQQAADAAKLVIDSKEYALLPKFRDNFIVGTENAKESIFEIQNSDQISNNWNSSPDGGQAGAGLPQWVRPWCAGQGWGACRPSANLQAAFETGDDRRQWTVTTNGVKLEDGTVLAGCGTDNMKMWGGMLKPKGSANQYQYALNFRVYRYADLLLVMAEALTEAGKQAEAIPYLNQVRTRAALPATKAVSQAEVRQAIRNERRVELAHEYHRLFDLRRWGIAAEVLTAANPDFKFVKGKHELFPIPQTEIDSHQGALKQNPGY